MRGSEVRGPGRIFYFFCAPVDHKPVSFELCQVFLFFLQLPVPTAYLQDSLWLWRVAKVL